MNTNDSLYLDMRNQCKLDAEVNNNVSGNRVISGFLLYCLIILFKLYLYLFLPRRITMKTGGPLFIWSLYRVDKN